MERNRYRKIHTKNHKSGATRWASLYPRQFAAPPPCGKHPLGGNPAHETYTLGWRVSNLHVGETQCGEPGGRSFQAVARGIFPILQVAVEANDNGPRRFHVDGEEQATRFHDA